MLRKIKKNVSVVIVSIAVFVSKALGIDIGGTVQTDYGVQLPAQPLISTTILASVAIILLIPIIILVGVIVYIKKK